MNWERWTLTITQLKICVVIWLHWWKLFSIMRWKYQRIRLTFVLPAMICCCCILVLGILRLARSFWSCSTFFDYLNSVLHPLVERTSEDLDGMLKMCRHSITRPLQSVFRNRKPAFRTPGFPEKICTVHKSQCKTYDICQVKSNHTLARCVFFYQHCFTKSQKHIYCCDETW